MRKIVFARLLGRESRRHRSRVRVEGVRQSDADVRRSAGPVSALCLPHARAVPAHERADVGSGDLHPPVTVPHRSKTRSSEHAGHGACLDIACATLCLARFPGGAPGMQPRRRVLLRSGLVPAELLGRLDVPLHQRPVGLS